MTRKMLVWGAVGLGGVLTAAIAILAYVVAFAEPPARGGPPTMRLVSPEQYRNTVHDVFGQDIEADAAFPVLQRQDGLVALGAANATMTPSAFDQFDRAARVVAAQAVDPQHRDTLVPCTPRAADQPDPACARMFFGRVGRLLYRRPLSPAELQLQETLSSQAATARGDFYEGLTYGLAGMLSSPKFLYITELTEPDPGHPGRERLDGYSRASRLSLLLWNALPDDELLAAAQRGELGGRAGRARQIERMLASPRLEQGVRGFFGDLLQFQDFETVSKDPVIYPSFTFEASQAVNEQTLRMVVDELIARNGDYRDLFTTHRSFASRALGPLYRMPVAAAAGDEWVPVELDRKESAGVVTAVSFLAAHSHPGRSSPTLRGRAIREIFLCQRLPDPPPSVNFTVFENLSGKLTARDRLQAHVTDPACAGCHRMTDPLGLAFETYDGAGQHRRRENRALIRTDGEFDGAHFKGAADVGRALHDHPALTPCLARRVYAYGVGREPGPADRKWLAWVARRFAVAGYRVPALLRTIAESDGFYAVTPADQTTVAAALGLSVDSGGR